MDTSPTSTAITTATELEDLLGTPLPRVADKVRDRLHPLHRQWIGWTSLCMVSTSAADGTCDVSPKGDPPGFVHVLDDRTVAVPERPGNRRADGFRNILANPHVGLLLLVPGRDDTLRVNGRARLVRDAPYFDAMAVRGRRPVLALEVEVDEVFFHCAKAFLRSGAWGPEHPGSGELPSRAAISHALERPEDTLEEVERYYGPGYAATLY